jgi:4-carboxymuconolactone decarboxylase
MHCILCNDRQIWNPLKTARAKAMKRLPEITPEAMDPDQRKFYESVISGPRGKFGGPFPALLHSPLLGNQVQTLGEMLRFHSSLDAGHREMAILVVARHWQSQVEWNAHVVIALDLGVSADTIRQIRDWPNEIDAEPAEQAVYRFARELLTDKKLSPQSYQNMLQFAEMKELVDLIVLLGYFDLLSMLLNTFEVEARPEDGIPPDDLLLEID